MAERYLNPNQSAELRKERATNAAQWYDVAAERAKAEGWQLRCHTPFHYSLRWGNDWLLHIYPSNRRLYVDPIHKGPYLKVKDNWNLLDVLAACKAICQQLRQEIE